MTPLTKEQENAAVVFARAEVKRLRELLPDRGDGVRVEHTEHGWRARILATMYAVHDDTLFETSHYADIRELIIALREERRRRDPVGTFPPLPFPMFPAPGQA